MLKQAQSPNCTGDARDWTPILHGYREPHHVGAVLEVLIPAVPFVLPIGEMRSGWRPWLSTMGSHAAIALLVVTAMWFVGVGPFLRVHLPITLLAASTGVWLFYVQHQFEDTFWAEGRSWSLYDAALHGSSHYDPPVVVRWFTANIGIHHVHHLCSRIPYYRLPRVLRDHPELISDAGRLTPLQSLGCVRLALWDEARERLISLRESQVSQRVQLKKV